MQYIRYNPKKFGLEGFLEANIRAINKLIAAIDSLDIKNPNTADLADSLCNNIYDLEDDLEYIFGKNWHRK